LENHTGRWDSFESWSRADSIKVLVLEQQPELLLGIVQLGAPGEVAVHISCSQDDYTQDDAPVGMASALGLSLVMYLY